MPLDWATTQNNLGAALWELGRRERGRERLEEAVSAYRLALEELTRERVPLDWAKSSYFGALTLLELARRTGDSAFREQASAQLEAVKAWADAAEQGDYYRAASAALARLERDEDRQAQ